MNTYFFYREQWRNPKCDVFLSKDSTNTWHFLNCDTIESKSICLLFKLYGTSNNVTLFPQMLEQVPLIQHWHNCTLVARCANYICDTFPHKNISLFRFDYDINEQSIFFELCRFSSKVAIWKTIAYIY